MSIKIDYLSLPKHIETTTPNMTTSIQVCSMCRRSIEPNKALYRCGDTNTCSPECNIKRLEHICSLDPNLSSPTRWLTNRTFRYDMPVSPTNVKIQMSCNEESCSPESHHPEAHHPEVLCQEAYQELYAPKDRLRYTTGKLSLKRLAFATSIPISIILCRTLLSLMT